MGEKMVLPSDEVFTYSGRIDFDEKDAPVFVYPCSSVRFVTNARACRLLIENVRSYWDSTVGILIDGAYRGKEVLRESGLGEISLARFLDGERHEVTVYKCMDACHEFLFKGLFAEEEDLFEKAAPAPARRMEFYGDSVTAGEVSEAVHCVGRPDPEHNGEFSNSFYSYAWMTARKLGAELHDIAQGGIALLDGTGYFCGPDNCLGMWSVYDKIEYHPDLLPVKSWDFASYTPHVVVLAIGQNDAHPENIMQEDYRGAKAERWRGEYARFVRTLRGHYPQAHIILTTTVLGHAKEWDDAIDEVCGRLADSRVHHFLYRRNGRGTPGHIRIPEAEEMAEELSAFIEGLGEDIWN